MNIYEYIDKSGKSATIEAASADEAIKNAPNRASNSGVMLSDKYPRNYGSDTPQESENKKKNKDETKDPLEDIFTEEAVSKRRKEVEQMFAERRERLLDEVRSSSALRMKDIEQTGAENLASQSSINLRAGLGGSDFGAAAKAEVKENTSLRRQNEIDRRKAEISNVLKDIDDQVATQFEKEEARLTKRVEDQKAEREKDITRAMDSIKALGRTGLDLEKIKTSSPDTYEKLKTLTGKGDIEIQAILDMERMDAGKINWNYKTVGSKVLAYGYDPISGTIKTMEQDLGINLDAKTGGSAGYKTTFAPDGTLLLIPSNLSDPSQIIVAGGFGKPDVKESRAKANEYLSAVTGADGKVSPEDFKIARNAWIADGNAGDDFNKEFSSYVNFSDVDSYGVPLELLQ